MQEVEKLLNEFLKEELPGFDGRSESDQNVLMVLSSLTEYVEEENTRGVYLTEDSDGSMEGYSLKLSNIFSKGLTDWMNLFGKTTAIFGIVEFLKLASAFLLLVPVFYEGIKEAFNEQDAKVLFSIFKLHQKNFSLEEVRKQFQKSFETEHLPSERLEATLLKLSNTGVLLARGKGEYNLIEPIKYKRK